MEYTTGLAELLQLNRRAIDRYSLQSVFDQEAVFQKDAVYHWIEAATMNINTIRAAGEDGSPPVETARFFGALMLSEAYVRVLRHYQDSTFNDLFSNSWNALKAQAPFQVKQTIHGYLDEFPPAPVYHRAKGVFDFLADMESDPVKREKILKHMILTWLHSENPAELIFNDLFDTETLKKEKNWDEFFQQLRNIWDTYPGVGESHAMSLLDFLMLPMQHSDTIEGQLRFISENWNSVIGEFSDDIILGLDLIQELVRPEYTGEPAPAAIPVYDHYDYEPEAYSPDVDWMPDVILLAKNVYVWLDQLSRIYKTSITTLDQIPDSELKKIAYQGFNALWLIGLWQRSHASETIKRFCGNPEAAASAYSIADYRIADDLGGNKAFEKLKKKAWKHGIRMAGDMVPNHMGIDSWWLCQHPEWFISSETNPYPEYTYTGADLSPDSRCSIYLEDHYYDKTNAAVTFKYTDNWNDRTFYVYHGNDGTGLPWNDTAQLNFLREDVREQVIETIISVARQFPIIRFDAAMTLAKKHFHRLWFPEPGSGGDIPSRSWFGMSKRDFDKLMPLEFWREVVDRIAVAAPDTLLLAEAFWLLEGYFVRSLGMHRVYNSAFMNMLRDEENQKYRSVIKNTIEFDPEILKRYVNFMSNPDEEPAVQQFGKGDKYFGICAMMSTLPGLPMFGHGQFEGFSEKYGMEYRKSYLNETIDEGLQEHHENVITPILNRRRIFSGAVNFRLFDFFCEDMTVDENIFVYLNRDDSGSGLFIFNNSSSPASGKIQLSAARNTGSTEKPELQQDNLTTYLQLRNHKDVYLIMRDLISDKWFIHRSKDVINNGIHWDLQPYEHHVFIDIQEVIDSDDKPYASLYEFMQDHGCVSIDHCLIQLTHWEIYKTYEQLFDDEILLSIEQITRGTDTDSEKSDIIDLDAFSDTIALPVDNFIEELNKFDLNICGNRFKERLIDQLEQLMFHLSSYRISFSADDRLRIIWTIILWKVIQENKGSEVIFQESKLHKQVAFDLIDDGWNKITALTVSKILYAITERTDTDSFEDFFQLDAVKKWIQLNKHENVFYFNREAFEELLFWLILFDKLKLELFNQYRKLAIQSGFRYEEFLESMSR